MIFEEELAWNCNTDLQEIELESGDNIEITESGEQNVTRGDKIIEEETEVPSDGSSPITATGEHKTQTRYPPVRLIYYVSGEGLSEEYEANTMAF